jgi:putative transposase
MKKSRFTVEQIIWVLRETQAGATVKEVCAKHNISDQTYYGWKRKYGDMGVDGARRLKGLEEENQRLKRLVVDYAVQIQILKEVNAKNGEPVQSAAGGALLRGGRGGGNGDGVPCPESGPEHVLPRQQPESGKQNDAPGDHDVK